MIILHSQHEKGSREFVEEYQKDHEIFNYPECIQVYPNISAFPSVLIFIPGYTLPDEIMSREDGTQFTIDGMSEEDHSYAYPAPKNMEEVEEYVKFVNQRALDHPYKSKTNELDLP